MKNSTGYYPGIGVDGAGTGIVSQAGAVLLTETAKALGLPGARSQALAPWRKPFARHDPGKILLDQALSLAMGGDCLADVDRLRTQPGVFGLVASDPTVSRLIRDLGADNTAVLAAINATRARIRARAWEAAGNGSPLAGAGVQASVVVDLDASLVTAHSEKENAKPTYKKGFGFHPLAAFVDHGANGTGEPLAMMLRPGNAGSNTAADHIKVTEAALAQLPEGYRSGRATMIRTDSAGGTHEFLAWLTDPARDLAYSVGFGFSAAMEKVLPLVPENGWSRAYNSDGIERDGAWIADITGTLDLSSWPAGLRVIVRKEIPHPGAQLRITDIDGMRYTAFATNQAGGQLADLEVRHRLRARCEDRIRISKDTGLANLPLASFASNEVWVHLVMLATELTAWAQMLALTGTQARRWEPKRLRARIFETAGRIVRTGRRFILHLAAAAPETPAILQALDRLRALPAPG
ncbi:IS1380 family transposase [Arthrobacter sp. MP_2.3]|uniref:IS1380 family transposase n=1 Tax=Arthrobacter sp. MP_2.3 TaxID=3349633 RepID=UPI0038D4D356